MAVLIIGPEEKFKIAEALAKARQNPAPWQAMEAIVDGTDTDSLDLADRKPGVKAVRRQYPPQHLMLGSYRVAISFEQQPTGLFKHLSISSNNRAMVPGLEVLQIVLEEFGFSGWPLERPNRIWAEEFEPGWRAINVIELEET